MLARLDLFENANPNSAVTGTPPIIQTTDHQAVLNQLLAFTVGSPLRSRKDRTKTEVLVVYPHRLNSRAHTET